MHLERREDGARCDLGLQLRASEFEVGDEGYQIAHGREGAMLVEVLGGCRFGNLYTFSVVMVDVLAVCAHTSMPNIGWR
jgi:hypothetical protein